MKDVGTRCSRCRTTAQGSKGSLGAVRGLGFSRRATYFGGMLRIEPCLPSPAERPPTGPEWVHEIKHDGYRLMARRDPVGIRLLTRNGHDWAPRYPLIVDAVNALKVRWSCLIDGEAVFCDEDGRGVFERLRKVRRSRQVFLCAFDLLELDGKDLSREPLDVRKATLASLLRARLPGCSSISISHTPVTSYSVTPARWALRASCRSGSARAMSRAGPVTGSSSRTRRRRR
jgi:ATP-dependent DNA ligase